MMRISNVRESDEISQLRQEPEKSVYRMKMARRINSGDESSAFIRVKLNRKGVKRESIRDLIN
jgi:hypothetical protein